jgi:zinc protease
VSGAAVDRTRAPEPAPIRPFAFPSVERRRLENGLTFMHARSGELPLVTVRAVLDAGAAAEAAGEEGLAWLMTQAFDGGTRTRTGGELAWALERLGAELKTLATWDGIHIALTAPSNRLADALLLLADVVRQPAFPEAEVVRARGEQLAEILRRRTEPRALADDMAARFIYADGATYGRMVQGIESCAGGFTAADVRRYYTVRAVPGASAVVVAGAVDADAAEAAVRRAFGDWSGPVSPLPPVDAAPRHSRAAIHLVDRAGAVQSELRIGHVGLPRDTVDYYPLLVMNAILGGVFTSRLNVNLREKHGFTYGVRSGFAFRRGAGPFVIQTAVASDVTARAIRETLFEVRRLIDDGIAQEEAVAARDFLAGAMPLEMQTTEQLAARIADLFVYDLPDDHFESARKQLRAVDAADAHRVAQLHLHPDRFTIIVVGNATAVSGDIEALGLGEVMVES